ncbi:metallophosphoesterase [Gemella sp. GH3]|nr:metallophosphoesterase [Gemella sp. GH3.1]NYS50253.1 metallophosphoesterase [Gemella sp. GH3]
MLTKTFKITISHKLYKIIIIIPFIISILVTSYGYINAHNIVKKEYTITSTKIKNDKGYKIGLISDVHFGNTFSIQDLEKYRNQLNDENLDFLVLAGDIIDEFTKVEDYEKVFNMLGSINTKNGVYYIHGNHDESRYTNPKDNRKEKLLNAIKNVNITFLNEESINVTDDIIITGRIDYSYRNLGVRYSSNDLIKNLDKEKYLIVADHQPSIYQENKNAGYDLQLSGHTHAGQIWPFGYVTRAISFDYGYLKEDNFNLIVSSGFGVWGYPIRTEEKSEYVIINIEKE